MKKLLFFTLFLFSFSFLEANHIVGGNMSYECLGNNEYKIKMTVYRDCSGNGGQFDSTPDGLIGTVNIYRGNLNFARIELDSPTVTRIQLNQSIHPCPDNLNLCVDEGIYEFQVNLPLTSLLYTITYQRCCRTSSVSNLLFPDETGITLTTAIYPFAVGYCNSSPIFSADQVTIACVNETTDLNFSATDPDGDELKYFLCSPLLGGGLAGTTGTSGSSTDIDGVAPDPDAPPPYVGVDFIAPNFNTQTPFGEGSLLELDSLSGIMSIAPKIIGQFAFGVCIQEYRNGMLLSSIVRDIEVNTLDCNPNTSICNPNSVSHKNINNEIELFPNPTDSDFTILSDINIAQIKIYDINGQLLETVNDNVKNVRLGNYPSGVYLIVIQDESGLIYRNKVLKM